MKPDFSKYNDALLPVIIQDANSLKVLMLGFMNEEAFSKTQKEGKVSFYSRSKKRLWTKGESSGNSLEVKEILLDCDADTLLIKAIPAGPVCHTGNATCFKEDNSSFSLAALEEVISQRKNEPVSSSYTSSLFAKGINAIVQKVGEEAVELVIAGKEEDQAKFLEEAADLMFHYLVLLQEKGTRLNDVVTVLAGRHKK